MYSVVVCLYVCVCVCLYVCVCVLHPGVRNDVVIIINYICDAPDLLKKHDSARHL